MARRKIAVLITSLLLGVLGDVAFAQRAPVRRAAASRAIAIRAELAGVLLQSRKYDDAAREYRTLLALDPNNRSYRLGLARALAWGKRLRDAERELIVLERQRPGDLAVEALMTSVRSGLTPSSSEAASWLAGRPTFVPYRRILARALAREGRTTEALAHYDALLHARPVNDILIERAYVHVERRDFHAVERDVYASIASGATPEAYVLLGDLHRWRGDLPTARAWYVRARVLRAEDPGVAAAFARLARDERPPVAFMPDVGDAEGWQTTNTTASDNLGVNLTAFELRRGLRTRRGFSSSTGLKALRLRDQAPAIGGTASGYGADAAISRDVTHRQFYARARFRGGFVYHPSADLVPEAEFTLAAFAGAWGVGAEISARPAYPSLVTLASMLPVAGNGDQLREQSSSIAIAGPLGAVDVAARHQSSSLSDGNTRTGVQAHARFPARRPLGLVYMGNVLSYAQSSALYWSPESYVAHSIGAEYALRRVRGLSFIARLLPGIASTRERLATAPDSVTRRSAMQLGGGVETTYRARDWEIGAALSYGRGRAGAYERMDAMLRARFLP
jgi:hypothetical protein